MSENIYVGIDPGLDGAVAIVNGEKNEIHDCPTLKPVKKKGVRKFDIEGMSRIVRHIIGLDGPIRVCLEKAQAMPGQGVTSMFKTGYGMGLWEGMLGVSLGLDYELVSPRKWQKEIVKPILDSQQIKFLPKIGTNGKKLTKAEQRKETKRCTIIAAQTLAPEFELIPPRCRVPRDGRADAVCLALYAKMMYNN